MTVTLILRPVLSKQVEKMFQTAQPRSTTAAKPAKAATKTLAALDIKRATQIGVRMANLRFVPLNDSSDHSQAD